jgi:hypothetical protein
MKVTPELHRFLEVLRDIIAEEVDRSANGYSIFICHFRRLASYRVIDEHVLNPSAISLAASEFRQYVYDNIHIDFGGGGACGFDTFSSWLNVVMEYPVDRLNTISGQEYRDFIDLSNLARVCWLDRLLYRIEEGETEI